MTTLLLLLSVAWPEAPAAEKVIELAKVKNPYGLVQGPDKKLYICSIDDHKIYRLDLKSKKLDEVVTGQNEPYEVRFDKQGNLFFVDMKAHVVKRRDKKTGALTVVAGTGVEHMTPAVSPDGRLLVYARGTDAGTDLVALPLGGGEGRRITVGRGRASTQPSFSPDGTRLAYMSDRSGHPEVYIADVDGANAELLTAAAFGDRDYRASPDWSPDGRLVAFQSRNGGTFQIMTINLRDQTVRQVTDVGRNDDPSWAPDSRHLVFTSSRSGARQLWITDIETGRTRQLPCGSECRLAAWSPRLAP